MLDPGDAMWGLRNAYRKALAEAEGWRMHTGTLSCEQTRNNRLNRLGVIRILLPPTTPIRHFLDHVCRH